MARSKQENPLHQPAIVASLNTWGSVVAVGLAPADNENGKYCNVQLRLFASGDEGGIAQHIFIGGRDAVLDLRGLCDKLLAAIPADNEDC